MSRPVELSREGVTVGQAWGTFLRDGLWPEDKECGTDTTVKKPPSQPYCLRSRGPRALYTPLHPQGPGSHQTI